MLGHVGLLEPLASGNSDANFSAKFFRNLRQYEAFQGKHAICVAYRKAAWSRTQLPADAGPLQMWCFGQASSLDVFGLISPCKTEVTAGAW